LETALMRLLRGAGPAGLASIRARRSRLLRPLLSISRAGILEYLAEKGLTWREDSTNADTRFFRNRIRHCLVPHLDDAFSGWRGALAAMSETQALAAAFIKEEAVRRVSWTPVETEDAALCGRSLRTGAENFFAQSLIIREEALFLGINRLLSSQKKDAGSVKRAQIRRFCKGQAAAMDIGLPGLRRTVRVRHLKTAIVIAVEKAGLVSESGFSLLIKAPGLYTLKGVTLKVGDCGVDAQGAFFASLPLVLRPATGSDRVSGGGRNIAPAGLAKGGYLWSAVDRQGTAAFINAGGVCAARSFSGDEAARICVCVV
jgi:tRNA(Ile)-lysidine synthase